MAKTLAVIAPKEELSRNLGVSRQTVYRWIDAGLPVEFGEENDIKKIKTWVTKHTGYSKVAALAPVAKKLQLELNAQRELLEFVKGNRADLLLMGQMAATDMQDMIRDTIAKEDIEKWTPDQKARWHQVLTIDFGTKFDKQRLEDDLSTENVAILYQRAQQLKRKKLEQGGG